VNFLNVGPWEVTVILIIAILVVGPKRMVEVGRAIGRTATQMRRLSGEFLGTLQAEIDATQQGARQALEGIVETGEESVAELQAAEDETRQVLEGIGEDRRRAATSIRSELEAVEHDTREAMQDILGSMEGLVKGESTAEKGEDGEASQD
jgi:Sec-independent protein translocase protein TatA